MAAGYKDYRDVYEMIFHYLSEDEWRAKLAAAGFPEVEIGYIFSARQLFWYDVLNMQVFWLRFFFAQRAYEILSRRPWLRAPWVWAAGRIAANLMSRLATRENATRYFIRATRRRGAHAAVSSAANGST